MKVKILERDKSVRFDATRMAGCIEGVYWVDFQTTHPGTLPAQMTDQEVLDRLSKAIRYGKGGMFLQVSRSGRMVVQRQHYEQFIINALADNSIQTAISFLYAVNDISLAIWFLKRFVGQYYRGEKVSGYNKSQLATLICNFSFEGKSRMEVMTFKQLAKELIMFWLHQGWIADASRAAWSIGQKISDRDFEAAFEKSCSLCYEMEVQYGMQKLGMTVLPRNLAASFIQGFFSWIHKAKLNYVFLMDKPNLSTNFTQPELAQLLVLARETGNNELIRSLEGRLTIKRQNPRQIGFLEAYQRFQQPQLLTAA